MRSHQISTSSGYEIDVSVGDVNVYMYAFVVGPFSTVVCASLDSH